ncbi:hypothetical protein ACER0A_001470 [Haloimpatiens sp. FM7315]
MKKILRVIAIMCSITYIILIILKVDIPRVLFIFLIGLILMN